MTALETILRILSHLVRIRLDNAQPTLRVHAGSGFEQYHLWRLCDISIDVSCCRVLETSTDWIPAWFLDTNSDRSQSISMSLGKRGVFRIEGLLTEAIKHLAGVSHDTREQCNALLNIDNKSRVPIISPLRALLQLRSKNVHLLFHPFFLQRTEG